MKSVTRFNNNFKGTVCLNCKQLISKEDNFCPNCGQVNDKNPISVKQYFSEYLSGFFEFDSRFIRTILPLLFKPGLVTKNYVEGKRRSYVNPFQLYIHITILFFLILGIFGTIDKFNIDRNLDNNELSEINKEDAQLVFDTIKSSALSEIKKVNPDFDVSKINSNIDSINEMVQRPLNQNDSISSSLNKLLKLHIDSVFANSNYLEQFKSEQLTDSEKDSILESTLKSINNYSLVLLSGGDEKVKEWSEFEHISEFKNNALDHIENIFGENNVKYKIPDDLKLPIQNSWAIELMEESSQSLPVFKKLSIFLRYDSQNKDIDIFKALNELGYEVNYWNVFYFSKVQNLNRLLNDEEFAKSYWDNIISKISVALFFLLPIFTLVLALLYIRNKYNYTEHLVFVFHVQTVFFILLILAVLIDRIFKTDIGILFFFLIFLFYLYKALRNFYEQGRFKTIIKFFILNFFFVILSFLGGVVISFLAFLV